MIRYTGFFILCLFALLFAFVSVDRYFLKANQGFCIRHIYSSTPLKTAWNISDHCSLPEEEMKMIFSQPFFYLGKGHQSFVFQSRDHQYVLKFYRFPSHLRPFPWLNHPIASRFKKKRQQIEQYNLKKLEESLQSYQLAFSHLQEESALICIHLARTASFITPIQLVDPLGQTYSVPLHETCFLLQKKGDLIFPTLKQFISENRIEEAKLLIQNIFAFISQRMSKGIEDKDAMLRKNYGCFGSNVFQLDVGKLSYNPHIQDIKEIKKQQAHICQDLGSWLQKEHQELYEDYINLINEK